MSSNSTSKDWEVSHWRPGGSHCTKEHTITLLCFMKIWLEPISMCLPVCTHVGYVLVSTSTLPVPPQLPVYYDVTRKGQANLKSSEKQAPKRRVCATATWTVPRGTPHVTVTALIQELSPSGAIQSRLTKKKQYMVYQHLQLQYSKQSSSSGRP